MIDIVIPYRKTPSEELKWAVKSLRNLKGVNNIYVVGDKPDYEVDAQFIPHQDNEWSILSAHHNQISKYLKACSLPLSDEIILANDDFYVLEETEPKNYNRGFLTEHINERRYDTYTKALINTRRFLKTKGLKELDFEMHIPMAVNREKLKQAIEEIVPMIRKGRTILIRSYYGNRFGIESEYMEDVKNKLPLGVYGSSSDKSFKGEYGQAIKEALK